MRFNIRTKLIAFSFCIVLLVGGGITVYSVYQGGRQILANAQREARATATLTASTIANDLYLLDFQAVRSRLQSVAVNPDVSYVYVTDLNGAILSDGTKANSLQQRQLTDPFSQAMLRSNGWISAQNGEILRVGGPVSLPDGSKIGHIELGFSLRRAHETLRGAARESLFVTALCLLVGGLLAFFFSASFTRPLLSVVKALKEIGAGKTETRLQTPRSDELGILAESVNEMAAALRKRQLEEIKEADESLRARYKELQTLHEMGQAILRSPDLRTVLEEILDQSLLTAPFDLGVIRLLDAAGASFVPMASRGLRDPKGLRTHVIKDPDGGRVIKRMAALKEPLVVENVPEQDGMRTFKKEGIHSTVMIPVRTEEEFLGVIQFGSRTPRKFQPHEIRLLEAIGNQMGLAVQKARLFEQTKQRAEELAVLHATASTFNQCRDMKTALQSILDEIVKVIRADAASLRLIDRGANQLEVMLNRGFPESFLAQRQRMSDLGKAARHVVSTGEIVLIGDLKGHPFFRGGLIEGFGFRSAIYLPVRSRDKLLGILNLVSMEPDQFGQREKETLLAVGHQLGLALENFRLFEETQRHLRQIQALHEIDLAITSTLDFRSVLEILLEKIDLALPYAATTVRLVNRETGQLEPVACRNIDEKQWKEEKWQAGRGTPNIVFETKLPLMIPNVQNDRRARDPEFFRTHGLVSYLGVPLVAKEEALGVLSFYTKEEHEFSPAEIDFLITLASQAAVAIYNSQLYEKVTNQAKELEEANRAKDDFLSIMSHELKTPLYAIVVNAGMIQQGIFGQTNSEQNQALGEILKNSEELTGLINTVLDVSKLQAGKAKVERETLDLKRFLDDLKAGYSFPLGKNLALTWDYPKDLPPLYTDAAKLKHVLQNLINNAIKYTERGKITVSASLCPQSQGVKFQVADTGIGIPQEKLPTIFEMFRQVDGSTTRSHSGVGLGLYIVKSFTEMLGGTVEVQSDLNQGSIFTVTLPQDHGDGSQTSIRG